MNKNIAILKSRFLFLIAILLLFCFSSVTGYAKSQEAAPAPYGIGSVSKLFTTAAVMKLAEEGKITLDTPLTEYIPEFRMADERYKKITPKMLLNHSSGIMGTTLHNGFLAGNAGTSYHDTFLAQLEKQELKADPGEYSVYCNDGFTLAEILIERVSGMSFSEFIRTRISEPLNLNTTFTPRDGMEEEAVAPVYYDNHRLPYINCQLLGSGGIYSTSEDLCRFSQIFMKNRTKSILSEESLSLMSKPWYLEDEICVNSGDSQIGYGLGWDSVNAYPYNLYGLQAFTKGGDVNGYHSSLTVLPEQNLSIAITSSGGSSQYCQEAAQDILLKVLKEEGLLDEIKDITVNTDTKQTTVPLPDEMRQYEGYYISQNIIKITFSEEGTLLLTPIDIGYDTVQEYVYTESGEFVSTRGQYLGSTGDFLTSGNGRKGVTKFTFRKESNGKTYILGTSYESTDGLGEFAATIPLAEKAEGHRINESILQTWKERAGKSYYLVKESWNSQVFLADSIIHFGLSPELKGYVTRYKNKKSLEVCKITDETTAKQDIDLPLMLGRDLSHYKFSGTGQAEQVFVASYRYTGQASVKSSDEFGKEAVIIDENLVSWYKIEKKDAAAVVEIKVPNQGAYYVYDREGRCISSSLFQDEPASLLLPEDGYVALAGEKGAAFHIIRK